MYLLWACTRSPQESSHPHASVHQITLCVSPQESSHPHGRRRRGRPSNTSFLHSSISSMDVSCLLEASLFSLSSPAPSSKYMFAPFLIFSLPVSLHPCLIMYYRASSFGKTGHDAYYTLYVITQSYQALYVASLSESLGKIKKSPGSMSPLVGVVTSSSGSSSSSQKTEDSARRHIASELLQTEKNFVEILDTIVKVLFMHYEQL